MLVIFRAQSDVEASVVRALLEAHGIPSVLSSDVPHSVFPLTVAALGEVRISVNESDAPEAHRIIASHRTELPEGRVIRLRDEFVRLETTAGYRFRDVSLLEQAMTHTSRANEDPSGEMRDNESLEFLGDAVLGFVVADTLFREFPEFSEGEKSKVKAALVSTAALARRAELLSLGDFLLLGRGEEKTGGRRKPALLANAYEALLAAIYLDGGIEQSHAFIARQFAPSFEEIRRGGLAWDDSKSELQEYAQSRDLGLPEYRLAGTAGPDHRKLFEVDVLVQGETLAKATGVTKKEAEQQAARRALDKLKDRGRES